MKQLFDFISLIRGEEENGRDITQHMLGWVTGRAFGDPAVSPEEYKVIDTIDSCIQYGDIWPLGQYDKSNLWDGT